MEEDESLWREYHCYYDKEEEKWLIVIDSFEEFRNKLNQMRSINHSGEVAEYMLTLSINELGRSFLTIDDYISQDQPYTKAVPIVMEFSNKNKGYKHTIVILTLGRCM